MSGDSSGRKKLSNDVLRDALFVSTWLQTTLLPKLADPQEQSKANATISLIETFFHGGSTKHASLAKGLHAGEQDSQKFVSPATQLFEFGNINRHTQGLMGVLRLDDLYRSIEQECKENDRGRYAAEYNYVVYEAAVEKIQTDQATGVKRIVDKGHGGMKLIDFVNLELSLKAGLTFAHCAVIRLYTGALYCAWNSAFRDLLGPNHGKDIKAGLRKWATCIAVLYDAIIRLSSQTPTELTLWRGLDESRRCLPQWFLDKSCGDQDFAGGVEMAFMSTSRKFGIAHDFSGENGTICCIKTSGACRPADLVPYSLMPEEEEMLFPPFTLLECTGTSTSDDGTRIAHINAAPSPARLNLDELNFDLSTCCAIPDRDALVLAMNTGSERERNQAVGIQQHTAHVMDQKVALAPVKRSNRIAESLVSKHAGSKTVSKKAASHLLHLQKDQALKHITGIAERSQLIEMKLKHADACVLSVSRGSRTPLCLFGWEVVLHDPALNEDFEKRSSEEGLLRSKLSALQVEVEAKIRELENEEKLEIADVEVKLQRKLDADLRGEIGELKDAEDERRAIVKEHPPMIAENQEHLGDDGWLENEAAHSTMSCEKALASGPQKQGTPDSPRYSRPCTVDELKGSLQQDTDKLAKELKLAKKKGKELKLKDAVKQKTREVTERHKVDWPATAKAEKRAIRISFISLKHAERKRLTKFQAEVAAEIKWINDNAPYPGLALGISRGGDAADEITLETHPYLKPHSMDVDADSAWQHGMHIMIALNGVCKDEQLSVKQNVPYRELDLCFLLELVAGAEEQEIVRAGKLLLPDDVVSTKGYQYECTAVDGSKRTIGHLSIEHAYRACEPLVYISPAHRSVYHYSECAVGGVSDKAFSVPVLAAMTAKGMQQCQHTGLQTIQLKVVLNCRDGKIEKQDFFHQGGQDSRLSKSKKASSNKARRLQQVPVALSSLLDIVQVPMMVDMGYDTAASLHSRCVCLLRKLPLTTRTTSEEGTVWRLSNLWATHTGTPVGTKAAKRKSEPLCWDSALKKVPCSCDEPWSCTEHLCELEVAMFIHGNIWDPKKDKDRELTSYNLAADSQVYLDVRLPS
jgi:hypothetical protein